MFTEERREKILELLKKNGRVIAKDLAESFDMSIDSIRRDLSIMEKDGLLKRTHGGAIELARVRNLATKPLKRYSNGSVYEDAIAKSQLLIYKKEIPFYWWSFYSLCHVKIFT